MTSMRWISAGVLPLAACAALWASCGGSAESTDALTREDGGGSSGTIRGSVLQGPICPVEQDPPDPNCADRPYATHLVLTSADQATVIKEFASDSLGRFAVTAAAGDYAIRSAAAANVLPYCASDETISVSTGATVDVTVRCDTGIR